VAARCDKSEHLYRIRAGSSAIAPAIRASAWKPAPNALGREARAEFGEVAGAETTENRTLGSSILFTSRLYLAHAVHAPGVGAQNYQNS
jgi:hypothetical protein